MSIKSQIEAIAKKRMEQASSALKASVVRVGNNVIIQSPVDKGAFINNWNTSIGGISYELKPDNESGSTSLSELKEMVSGIEMGEVAYFTNPLPYGPRLEYDGWSAKAPNGMLRINTAKWSKILNEEIERRK